MGVNLGANLKKILHERGKNILWLSETSGVSKYTLYSITRNPNIQIRPSTLNKICNALNIKPEELTEGKSNSSEKLSYTPTYLFNSEDEDANASSQQPSSSLDSLVRKRYRIDKSPDELQLTESEKIGYFEQLEHTYSIYWREAHQKDYYYNPAVHGEPPQKAVSAIEERRKHETILLKLMFDLTPENQIKMLQYGTQLVREQYELYNQLCDVNKNNK